MLIKRTWRDWLFLAVLLVVYVVAAILIGISLAFSCPAPDPEAKPVVSLSRGELSMLARLAWAENRSHGYCGMLSISSVVINRMRTNPAYFGGTVTQVIQRPNQFSVFGRNDPNRSKMTKVDESDDAYVAALLAAIAAVGGADITGGALYFYSGGAPAWSHGMAVTLRGHGHTFLKER